MHHMPSDTTHLLVLERGEELHESLARFASENDLTAAWLAGIGGASSVELGFYDLALRDYSWRTLDETLEIVSLTGNLSIVDGKPFWHIHGVFSDKDYQALGGHVRSMTVGLTCELHITPLDIALTRNLDSTTGLKLLEPADSPE